MSNRRTEKGPGSRAEQKAATRERLLRIAQREFAKSGYDRVGVDELCDKARVTHGALYHHFPGKLELFRAVVERLTTELATRVEQAALAHSGFRQVEAACDAYLEACADPVVQALVFRDGPRVLREQFEQIDHATNEPLVVGLMQGWIEQGLLRELPVPLVARMLGAAFAEAGAAISGADDPASVRTQVAGILHAWLRTLRPTRARG